jgi:hypothetical protein
MIAANPFVVYECFMNTRPQAAAVDGLRASSAASPASGPDTTPESVSAPYSAISQPIPDRVPHTPSLQRLVEGGKGSNAASARTTMVCPRSRSQSMTGRSTASQPSALCTLPGWSVAARQSPSWLETEEGAIADGLETGTIS